MATTSTIDKVIERVRTVNEAINLSNGNGSSNNNKKRRLLSEQDKMENLVNLCRELEDISSKLREMGYDRNEVPTWYYCHCKKIVNYLEGFARESKVKPSMLSTIRFQGGKRKAVIAKRRKTK